MKSRLLCTVLALAVPTLSASALFAPVAAQISISIDLAPPAPRYEVMPAPRPGYIWAPGHWNWNGREYAWMPGRWEQVRAGYRFVPERWERYDDNGRERWRFVASRWDRDGDGIPNVVDLIDNRAGPFFVVDVAPPPPRYEPVPLPRPGFIWAAGHWNWNGHQHVWAPGRWEQVRAGYRYVPERWERYMDNGRERWRYQASRWDRDGDGVPNQFDAHPNRTQGSGDRDRDGIPNRVDPNPTRAQGSGDRDRDGVPNRKDANDKRAQLSGDTDREGKAIRGDRDDDRRR